MPRRSRLASLALALLVGCAPRHIAAPAPVAALARAEGAYAATRAVKDRIDVTEARGAAADTDGTSIAELARRYAARRAALVTALGAVSDGSLHGEDSAALAVMRAALAGELTPGAGETPVAADAPPDCAYDARALAARPEGYDTLSARIYACYGEAARTVIVRGERMDRLTVLGLLPRTDDPARRRELFLALQPLWHSMNGDDGADSPYRQLVRLSAARWRAGKSPIAESARQLGLRPEEIEGWLVAILDRWRESTPDSMIEPWDFHYLAGAADRALAPRIPLDALSRLNESYFRALGADVRALGVHYDLVPRAGKTPVAFTTFGARAPVQPWTFATYRVGGLGNLNELLHETGHAIHIAAIRQRPAFEDWPDSDPFTEGVADVAALEVYEPAWQMRWLGDSVSTAQGMRARYAGVVLDVCWALFEMRMHRDPSADPNRVWSDLTSRYLHIVPHPELSWWGMRGQLVDAPGYMSNYAIGAVIIADIRERIQEARGDFARGDPGWYAWMTPRLYVFGRSRGTREVLARFLGRPLSPDALLRDMRRLRAGG